MLKALCLVTVACSPLSAKNASTANGQISTATIHAIALASKAFAALAAKWHEHTTIRNKVPCRQKYLQVFDYTHQSHCCIWKTGSCFSQLNLQSVYCHFRGLPPCGSETTMRQSGQWRHRDKAGRAGSISSCSALPQTA